MALLLYNIPMLSSRIVEYAFFFGTMAGVGYLIWLMFAPFVSALALAAIIVTICFPLYERVRRLMPRQNETLAALTTTVLVLFIVILPLVWLASILFGEALSVYKMLDSGQYSLTTSLEGLQMNIQRVVPGMDLNLVGYLRQSAAWFASNLGVIFAGTASTIFSFFIAIIGSFYFFRDGRQFTKLLIHISPLPDEEDVLILKRMAVAVRSVATGTILIAIIQGILTSIGLTFFGFDRAVLLGTLAAVGALMPSIGTSIVLIPSIGYLLLQGSYFSAIGLAIWAALAVGLIDNLLGPYLMSRGNTIHPFLILLSVLGGVSVFGPIGFIVGPVIVSVFKILLELYSQHISHDS